MSATASTRAIAALAVSLPDATMSSVAARCDGAKIGKGLGGALEILGSIGAGRGACVDRGLGAGDLPSQFVVGRVARSGGDREIRGCGRRVAHRLRAQSRGAQLFRAVRRDTRLGHGVDRFGKPARMIERMHGAGEPGVAFVGRRRVAFRQKIARLPHAVGGLRQRCFVKRWANGCVRGRALESRGGCAA